MGTSELHNILYDIQISKQEQEIRNTLIETLLGTKGGSKQKDFNIVH